MTVMSDGYDWNLASIRVLDGLPEDAMRELESNCVWKRFIEGDAIVDTINGRTRTRRDVMTERVEINPDWPWAKNYRIAQAVRVGTTVTAAE